VIEFTKMHGIGNDFIIVDAITKPIEAKDLRALARAMNDRRRGVGGDGLILVEPGTSAAYRMHMLNPDGSEGGMCGNGLRCVAKFLHQKGYLSSFGALPIEVTDRTVTASFCYDGDIQVDMGEAFLERGQIGMAGDPSSRFINEPIEAGGETYIGTAVSMGNPHLVIFVDHVDSVHLETIGPQLEHHPWFPERTNVHFVEISDSDDLTQRTWERGAGITLACGSGACACAVAAHLTGRTGRKVTIRLPGGDLQVEYTEQGRVLMQGPAETAFEGQWDRSDYAALFVRNP
jgi:diaminopimelate epimerase